VISDAQMAALAITRHDWHGEWNYTLRPAPPQPATASPSTPVPRHPGRGRLKHPALTGLTTLLARRLTLPGPVLAALFQVSTMTINKVIRQTQPQLTITGHNTKPTGVKLSSLTQLAQYAVRFPP
jgi:hypothetical protein